MDNLYIYEQGRSVPENAQKPFSNGSFSGTDINPMWRIKKLTELFGPAGIGWYTEVLSERAETYGDTVMAIVDINLYVKVGGEWSKPIFGTGGNLLVQVTKSGARPSDEGYKKAYTDALSIACKALGIGADIWYSKDVNADPTMKYAYGAPADKPPAGYQPEPPKTAYNVTAYEPSEPLPWDEAGGINKTTYCSECLQPITAFTSKSGKTVDPVWFAEKTTREHGKPLCAECAKKYRKKGAA